MEAQLRSLRLQLAALWAGALRIDPGAYEQRVESLCAELMPLLEQVGQLCSLLMDQCDSWRTRGLERGLAMEVSVLSDVCFMAMSEAATKRRELSALRPELNPLRSLAVCASVLRSVCKALVSVDSQLSRALGEPTAIDMSARLQQSLEIRVAYSILRRTAEATGAPSEGELRMRLKAIELRIQLLSEKELFLRLRLEDRLELRSLQRRLLGWLDGVPDTTSGRRLFQDALGFAQLLTQVNLRQELRDHDTAIVHDMLAQLEGSSATQLTDAQWCSLRPLLGLNDRLDDMLRMDQRDRAPCLQLLRGLADSLRPSRTYELLLSNDDSDVGHHQLLDW